MNLYIILNSKFAIGVHSIGFMWSPLVSFSSSFEGVSRGALHLVHRFNFILRSKESQIGLGLEIWTPGHPEQHFFIFVFSQITLTLPWGV